MLSIKFWLQLVNLVGEIMLGRRLVEHYDVIESQKHFYLSHILEDQYWTHQLIQDKLHQIYTMSPPQKIFTILYKIFGKLSLSTCFTNFIVDFTFL